jgi:hypothetical protein
VDECRWTSTIAWQAGNAQGIFIVGSLIQTIILVNNENYAFPNWHGALLAIAAMALAYSLVVFGSKALPYWQNTVFAVRPLYQCMPEEGANSAADPYSGLLRISRGFHE